MNDHFDLTSMLMYFLIYLGQSHDADSSSNNVWDNFLNITCGNNNVRLATMMFWDTRVYHTCQ